MYEKTQQGTIINMMVGIVLLILLSLAWMTKTPETLLTGLFLGIVLLLFWRMTVRVDPEHITISYGIGLIRKTIERTEIIEVAPVRNKWYYGFGIRIIPRGRLYNISGLDAVELSMKNGRVIRIGTADQTGLLAALKRKK